MAWKLLPSDIGSLSGWWRASDLTGVEGSLIAAWDEVSGEPGFTLAQTTDSLKPKLLKHHGYGQCVRFDGTDDLLESDSGGGDTFGDLLDATSKDGTIITVQRVRPEPDTTEPTRGLWGTDINDGSGMVMRNVQRPIRMRAQLLDSGGRETTIRHLETEYTYNQAPNSSTDPPSPIQQLGGRRTGQQNADENWDVALPFVCLWAHDSTAGDLMMSLNNFDDSHENTTTAGPPTAGDLAAAFRVGWTSDGSSGSWYWLGDVFEIIAFSAVLTEAQRRGIALYLSERYALPYLSGVDDSEPLESTPTMTIEMQLPVTATEDFDRYPEFLAKPTLWLKADAGVLDAGAAAASDGEAVATWEDQSGNGFDLVQTSAGNRPVWQDGSSPTPFGAGIPYVEFDPASSQFMVVDSGEPDFEDILGLGGLGSVVVVGYCTYADQAALATAVSAAIFGHTAAQGPGLRLRDISGVSLEASDQESGTGMRDADVASSLNTACVWIWNARGSYNGEEPAGIDVYQLADGDTEEASGSETTGEDTDYLGNDFSLGRGDYSSTTYYWKGYIAEVMVFPRHLNSQMREMVYAYLAARYPGLSLPATGRVWQDVTADVRESEGLSFFHGISGGDPQDRVGSPGECRFALENTQANSAQTVGYYSPRSSSKRDGFDIGTQVRVAFEWHGTKWIKWHGWISTISVQPGKRNRVSRVTAHDWFLIAENSQILAEAVAEDEFSSNVAYDIYSSCPAAQLALFYVRDKDSTPFADLYPIVFDDTRQGRSALGELARLASSRWGYTYERGDAFRGGRVVFEGRDTRMNSYPFNTIQWAVDDDDLEDLDISDHSYEGLINQVVCTLHPRRADGASTTVLFVLQGDPLEIAAGESHTFDAHYRDPESGRSTRVGGLDMVTPVATTDYTANSQADGGGTNKTADLGVSATFYGSSARITLTNNDAATIYVTLFQLRGKGIYYDESVTVVRSDADSIKDYVLRSLPVEMSYQQDIRVAEEIGDAIIDAYKDPRSRARSLSFKPRRSAERMMQALAREAGDRITLTETTSGLSAEDYHIQRVEFRVGAGGTILCRWGITPRLTL